MNQPKDSQDLFESLLADVMQSRPLPQRGISTVARAMAIARRRMAPQTPSSGLDAHQLEVLARQRRRGMLVNALAAAVVIAMLVGSLIRMPPRSSTTELETVSTTVQTDSNSAGSAASDSLLGLGSEEFVILCGAVLVGTLIALTLQRVLIADENAGPAPQLVGWTVGG
jgi:hypothetical protein